MSEPIAPSDVAVPESAEIMKIKNERALTAFDDPFASTAAYRHFMEIAKTFAASIFVPDHFRNKPGDCLIAINLAKRMDEDPLLVMQNIFVVKGRPGFYTSFMIARANRRAKFKSKIRWRSETLSPAELEVKGGWRMPNLRVTAIAVDEWGEEIAASVDTSMAIAEDWVSNTKYRSMPEHMLRWRAAAFLIRLFAPEVMMGMPTVEEAETMPAPVQGPMTVGDILIGPGGGGEAAAEPAPPADPAPPATAARLSAGQLAELHNLADRAGVSWSAIEEHFDGPLQELVGTDAGDIEALVVAEIRLLSGRPAEAGGSLFDGAGEPEAKGKSRKGG